MKVELYGDGKVMSLTGEVECNDPPYVAAALTDAKGKDLTIYIASPGGYTTPAMAVYDLIRSHTGWVTTVATGDCYSAAAEYLLQAGDHRMMTNHTLIMLHEGTVDKSEGSWASTEAWLKIERMQRDRGYQFMIEVIRKAKPKTSMAQMKKMFQSDWILNADEALEWGLIDEILTVLP